MKKEDNKGNKLQFPDGFFNIPRPTISMKETLKDVIPIEWNNKENEEVVVYSKKKNEILKASQKD